MVRTVKDSSKVPRPKRLSVKISRSAPSLLHALRNLMHLLSALHPCPIVFAVSQCTVYQLVRSLRALQPSRQARPLAQLLRHRTLCWLHVVLHEMSMDVAPIPVRTSQGPHTTIPGRISLADALLIVRWLQVGVRRRPLPAESPSSAHAPVRVLVPHPGQLLTPCLRTAGSARCHPGTTG